MGTLIRAIKHICDTADVESQRDETIMSEAKLTKEQLAKREQYETRSLRNTIYGIRHQDNWRGRDSCK